MTRVCEWCGDEVDKDDFMEFGGQKVYCCGKAECEKELLRDFPLECHECRKPF